MILGIDVSTSITGYTLLDEAGKIIECGHVDMRKEKNFFKKAALVEDALAHITSYATIQAVYIEQPFLFFKGGGSSGATMAVLQKFNGVVSWVCYNLFDIEPQYLKAQEARKLCGIKVPRGQKAKKVVMDFIIDNVPDFDVEYTRQGNPRPGYADRADSYVVARAGLTCENQETQDSN